MGTSVQPVFIWFCMGLCGYAVTVTTMRHLMDILALLGLGVCAAVVAGMYAPVPGFVCAIGAVCVAIGIFVGARQASTSQNPNKVLWTVFGLAAAATFLLMLQRIFVS